MPRGEYINKAGVQLPGVTTIMKALAEGSSDGLCTWAATLARQGLDWRSERQRAATLGTFCHDVLERFPCPLPARPPHFTNDEWLRVVTAYKHYAEWEAEVHPEILHHEVQLVSEKYGYGGCFDAIAGINGEAIILDIKTGKMAKPKDWAIQLAAYRQLVQENGLSGASSIKRGLVLHFPQMKFRPVAISPEQLDHGWSMFQTALTAYQQFKSFPKAA